MKKIVSFLAVMVIAICMTGCSKGEELKCTMEEDNTKEVIKATLSGDKITKVVVDTSRKYDDKEQLESDYSMSQMVVGMFSAIDGMKASVKKDGMSVKVSITMDIKKMKTSDLEDNFGYENLTKENFLTYAKDAGYTCK